VGDYIIKDSSIWEDSNSSRLLYGKDCSIRIGTIQEEIFVSNFGESKYKVEVWDNGHIVPVTCIRTSRFGGMYNYEEYSDRGYTLGNSEAAGLRSIQPGDSVVIAYINGNGREGVILGHIKHPGRKESINSPDNKSPNNISEFVNRSGPTTVRYISEFNGVETAINANGEHRVTFKGQPTNLAKLNEAPTGADIALPTYDTKVGSSYYEFDKTGSWYLNDNAKDGLQSIKVDKANGKIEIISGKTSLVINKKDETYTFIQKKVTFNTADEWNLNTKKTNIMSSAEINAKAAKINTEGAWTQKGNMDITGNIKQTGNTAITGNLSSTGITSLAGGQFPLIHDIVLTIGIGNGGAPVISGHVFLKTTMTKAT
jgi:hypothetical protein